MKQRVWNLLRMAAPLSLITFDFSLSQIPEFLTGTEMRTLLAQVITEILVGAADAVINLAVLSAFGLV